MRRQPFALLEKADFALRLLTFLAVLVGGVWALYLYKRSGSDDWTINMALNTEVLPYRDDLRLLVVHVKTKNPRSVEFELNRKLNDSFVLRLRKVPADAKAGSVIGEDEGQILAKSDLMRGTGGEYVYLPGAEMDDMRVIVLPAHTTVSLMAEMQIHNGTTDEHGKPDSDFVSISKVVRVEP